MKYAYFSIAMMLFSPYAIGTSKVALKPSLSPKTITIKEAIAQALEHNFSLKIQHNQVLQARTKTHSNLAKLVPDLSAQSSFKAEPAPRSAKAGLQLNVPLIDARSWIAVKASSESKSAAELTYAFEKDQVIHKVADLYCEALIAKSARDVLKEGIEKYRKQAQSFENRARVGTARNLDLLEALYQFNVAQHDLIDQELSLQEKLGELGQQLALTDSFELTPFEVENPHLLENADTLIAQAKESADLMSLKKEISSYGSLVLSDHFELLPRIFGSVDWGWQSRGEGGPFSSQIMLNLSWPLWNLSHFSSAESNKIHKSSSQLTLRHKIMEKELSVNGAIASIKAYEEAEKKNKRILELATLAADSTERIFNLGEATGLEVIDAHVKVFSAKSRMQKDSIKLKQNKLRLLFLIGKISEF